MMRELRPTRWRDSQLFAAALAQQCFINEYVFLPAKDEVAAALRDTARKRRTSRPVQLLLVAAYFPLHSLPARKGCWSGHGRSRWKRYLTHRSRTAEELRLRAEIPRLTAIKTRSRRLVQSQYEENPYPRWVRLAPEARHDCKFSQPQISRSPRFERPAGPADAGYPDRRLRHRPALHRHGPKFGAPNMLAVDLSLASLGLCQAQIGRTGPCDRLWPGRHS